MKSKKIPVEFRGVDLLVTGVYHPFVAGAKGGDFDDFHDPDEHEWFEIHDVETDNEEVNKEGMISFFDFNDKDDLHAEISAVIIEDMSDE